MISRVLGVTLAILHLCSCGLTLGVGEEAKQRPPLDGSPVAMDTNLTTLATTASTTPAAAQGDSSLQGVSHPKPGKGTFPILPTAYWLWSRLNTWPGVQPDFQPPVPHWAHLNTL